MKIYMKANIVKTQFFIEWCMTSEVIEGHIRSSFYLKIYFFFDILFVWNQILPKFGMNANITKMQIFGFRKFDLIINLTYVLIRVSISITFLFEYNGVIECFSKIKEYSIYPYFDLYKIRNYTFTYYVSMYSLKFEIFHIIFELK